MPLALFIVLLSEEHEHLADMLHGLRARLLRDQFESFLTGIAIQRCRPYLDQLVRVQGAIDLCDHLVGEPLRTDVNNRIELVGFRLERLAFGRA
jgi:hypothetical protein